MIAALAHRDARSSGQVGANPLCELGVRADAGPHRGPTQRKFRKLGERALKTAPAAFDLAGESEELLAEADRCGVLQMGPSGLDDRHEGLALSPERIFEDGEGWEQFFRDGDGCR